MKVFVSWSKEQSRDIGIAFAAWLPGVLQECSDPFISTDLVKGDAWFDTITTQLADAKVGIVFITPENMDETWLNFESGAMLTKFGKQRLCPVLVGMTKADYLGPLKNIQMTEFDDQQDMLKLMQSLNGECDRSIADGVLAETFLDRWPKLVSAVSDAASLRSKPSKSPQKRPLDSKVDEVLELVRELAMTASEKEHRAIARGGTAPRSDTRTDISILGNSAGKRFKDESSLVGRQAVSLKKSHISGKIVGISRTDDNKAAALVQGTSGAIEEIPMEDILVISDSRAG